MVPDEVVRLLVDVSSEIPAQLALEIEVTRYVNAAAFVILLYDHLLSLGSEVDLIWSAKWTSAKGMFLFIRYMVPCAMTVYTVQLSGLSHIVLSDIWWMSIAAFMGWATVAIILILLRLWVIWDRNRKLIISTLLCFFVSQTVGLVAASLLVWRMNKSLYWDSDVGMCAFKNPTPPVAILWAPGTTFEVILFGITWWNALTVPRSSNAPLAAAIYRDGLLYFLLLLCLRIINTVLAVAAPPGLIFIAMFPVWCATTTTTCRLVIKLRQISEDQTDYPDSVPSDDTPITVHGGYDEVQSGVHIEMLRSVGPSTPIRSSGWY